MENYFKSLQTILKPSVPKPSLSFLSPSTETLSSDDELCPSDDDDSPVSTDLEDSSVYLKHPLIFLTRTHSQLQQVISEFKQTSLSSLFRSSVLGSRKHFCNVPSVVSSADPSDACKRLRKKSQCQFYSKTKVSAICSKVLTSHNDIEDLVSFSKSHQLCPYFGTRQSSLSAHVIFATYNTLFTDSELLSLEGAILVVDEGHNLVGVAEEFLSCTLDHVVIAACRNQVEPYLSRYSSRLGVKNLRNTRLLLRLITALQDLMAKQSENEVFLTTEKFLELMDSDNVNFLSLHHWSKSTRLPQKLSGFTESDSVNGMFALQSFLLSISQPNEMLRIIISKTRIKIIAVDTSFLFSPILSKIHSLILASGTLFPSFDIEKGLFTERSSVSGIQKLWYPHVIPSSHFSSVISPRGPGGTSMRFNFSSRSNFDLLDDFSSLLVNYFSVLNGGWLCFSHPKNQ
ncbi:hypothetical protein GEMRC1_002043 [Eukaryota sp. GEM-RC1]